MNNFLTFHAEATPDGVNIMYRSNDGMTERVETVSYIDAVNRLDAGDYDDKPDEGMFIHLAIASGGNQGYFDYTSQHHVIMWRWLIATAFINEMRKENGTVSIIDDSGNHSVVSVYSNGIVAMPLYPVAERLAMANNIEGAMIEKYGVDVGTKNTIIFLQQHVRCRTGNTHFVWARSACRSSQQLYCRTKRKRHPRSTSDALNGGQNAKH